MRRCAADAKTLDDYSITTQRSICQIPLHQFPRIAGPLQVGNFSVYGETCLMDFEHDRDGHLAVFETNRLSNCDVLHEFHNIFVRHP